MKKITIDPITRLEGHGRIDIFLNDAGDVDSCFLVIPDIRAFEKFAEGRPVEDMALITPRICGVCPEAHHAASAKAIDAVFGATIPPTADLIRRLQYNAFVAADHATHFYLFGGPDFIVGPDASPAERNIIGVIAKVGKEVAGQMIRMRKEAHEVAEMLGGRRIHPVGMTAGGQSKPVTKEMQNRLIEIGRFMVEFARTSFALFNKFVLADRRYIDLILSEMFRHHTYYMGLVNEKNQVDVYDGQVRVVDPDGKEFAKYNPRDYLAHISEHVEPWTYCKIPFLKQVGWKGFVDGAQSGVYRSAPLGQLNASQGMQTPLAQAEYEQFFGSFYMKPVHATLAYHWARLIEMLQCAELTLKYANDERLTDPNIRSIPTETPKEGVGVVEAPRGLLTHHYVTDERGIVRRANLIVGTTNNYASINMSITKVARSLIRTGTEITENILNLIEMAFRPYDPCFGCAVHASPGRAGLTLNLVRPGSAAPTHRHSRRTALFCTFPGFQERVREPNVRAINLNTRFR